MEIDIYSLWSVSGVDFYGTAIKRKSTSAEKWSNAIFVRLTVTLIEEEIRFEKSV